MPFWTYMLHCRGGYFYVGHTDDLDRRISEHQSGSIPGFTADHQPIEFVWSQDFPTRDEAKAAERRIKGWSRAKKLALIRGDWDGISLLAKKKDSASTSSAQTEQGEIPDLSHQSSPRPAHPEHGAGLSFSLQPHPLTPPSKVQNAAALLRISDGLVWLTFEIEPGDALELPDKAKPLRTDGLWQSTCFELFVASEGAAYREFNFSPSSAWAAYRFSSYREGMSDQPMQTAPHINAQNFADRFQLTASLDARLLPPGVDFALSAVIEEIDGTKSYWALAHPLGKPDFHHPACFAATLPPPSRA
ncbi:MAG: GIY-YIG nuclease family protein [Novosphingobium sp.]